MITLERIEDLLHNHRLFDARAGCLKLLERDRKNGQAWAYLGHAMLGLKNGIMAKQCFNRSFLLDPFAPWVETAFQSAVQTAKGKEDKQIINLLKVPPQAVSAIVLTRNNERTIEACLRNLIPAVDEIIVVDTGSTDATIDIVNSLDIKVHYFSWTDDFSAARNYASSLTKGDWIIAVDSDEILYSEDVDSIRTVAGLFSDQPYLIKILAMNSVDSRQEAFQAGRMVKRAYGFTWKGRIHENLFPPDGMSVNSIAVRIRLLHDGYDPNKVDLIAKLERNIKLLQLEIQDRPFQPGSYYFMARELINSKKLDESLPYLEKAKELMTLDHPMRPDLRKSEFDVYNALGRLVDAESVMNSLTKELPDYPDGWFWLGMQMLKRSDSNMEEIVHLITTSKKLALQYRGQSNFDVSLITWKTDYVLAVIADQMGRKEEAQKFYASALSNNPQLTVPNLN